MSDQRAISLVVCSCNGAAKLDILFSGFRAEAFKAADAELILVANACTDDTADRMDRFAADCGFDARVLRVERPGLAFAQNLAVTHAGGRVIAFTDDDCRLADDYLEALGRDFDPLRYDYGGGLVLRADETDDPRVASTNPDTWAQVPTELRPSAMFIPGALHGANLFFAARAFRAVGGFDEDLGPGGVMGGADQEILGRATRMGYIGLALPSVRVHHHHGRKTGSPEAERIVRGYARSRGGYFATLVLAGETQVWSLWRSAYPKRLTRSQAARLELELRGAADYLRLRLDKPDRPGLRRPADWGDGTAAIPPADQRAAAEPAGPSRQATAPKPAEAVSPEPRPELVVMIHPGRCGSTVLGRLLEQHPDLSWRGEIFEPRAEGAGRGARAPLEWVEHQRRSADGKLAGIELKPWHSRFTGLPLRDLLDRLDRAYQIRVVLLWRRNLLRMMVSSILAEQTGRWHVRAPVTSTAATVRLEPTRVTYRGVARSLFEHLEALEQEHESVRAAVARWSPIALTYEDDVLASPVSAAQALTRRLGLASFEPRTDLSRTMPFPLADVVQNWDEVRRLLAGTRYAPFCHD